MNCWRWVSEGRLTSVWNEGQLTQHLYVKQAETGFIFLCSFFHLSTRDHPHVLLLSIYCYAVASVVPRVEALLLLCYPSLVFMFRVPPNRDIPMPLVSSGVEHGNLRELALARMKDMGTEVRPEPLSQHRPSKLAP